MITIEEVRGRLELLRLRKSPVFEQTVQECLREAMIQPFGSPLDIATAHARMGHYSPFRLAAWQEVVKQLGAYLKPSAAAAQQGSLAYGLGFSTFLWCTSASAAFLFTRVHDS